MEYLTGAPEGREKLERSVEFAQQAGLHEHVMHAYQLLVRVAFHHRSYALVNRYIEPGLEQCTEHGFDIARLYLLAYRARAELDQARWSEAVRSAALVLHERCISTIPPQTRLRRARAGSSTPRRSRGPAAARRGARARRADQRASRGSRR